VKWSWMTRLLTNKKQTKFGPHAAAMADAAVPPHPGSARPSGRSAPEEPGLTQSVLRGPADLVQVVVHQAPVSGDGSLPVGLCQRRRFCGPLLLLPQGSRFGQPTAWLAAVLAGCPTRRQEFMLLDHSMDLPDPVLARRALLVGAFYRLHCRLRHGPVLQSADDLRTAARQAVHEMSLGHVQAMCFVATAFAGRR
jgi:hypothetical protein